eukprot:1501834-Amphidinium_carterae.1
MGAIGVRPSTEVSAHVMVVSCCCCGCRLQMARAYSCSLRGGPKEAKGFLFHFVRGARHSPSGDRPCRLHV